MNAVGMRGWTLAAWLAATGAVFLVGCGGDEGAYESPTGDVGSQSSGATGKNATEIAAALAELSDEDRALAEKQKLCPVSNGPLGGMGKPYLLVLNGETVFLCCGDCKGKAEEDPEATVAKVSALVAANRDGSGGG